jgi:hypothetical protein
MARTTATEKALDKLFRGYCDQVEALAMQVREQYVIPFCDKHGLRFVAGMGSWCFWDSKGTYLFEAMEHIGDDWSTDERGLGYLHSGEETKRYRCKRMLHLLATPPDGFNGSPLGSLMDDYTPKALEKVA